MFPKSVFRIAAVFAAFIASPALSAPCGNDASGFERWKSQFAQEAAAAGIQQPGLNALAGARYATRTIAADRNQKGVKYALDDFIRIRLGSLDSFAAQATRRLNQNRAFSSRWNNAMACLPVCFSRSTGWRPASDGTWAPRTSSPRS